MKEYTHEELTALGFKPARLEDNSYLGKEYPDGRQIILKKIDGCEFYSLHGAVDSDLNRYGPDELAPLTFDDGSIGDLELLLQERFVSSKISQKKGLKTKNSTPYNVVVTTG